MKEIFGRLFGLIFSRLIGLFIVGGIVAAYTIYRNVSYVPTQAVMTEVETDCYIEDSNAKLTQKSSSELAYMACDLAPMAARAYQFSETAIKKRTRLTYSFVSPVDQQSHTDTYTMKPAYETIRVGEHHMVMAHKSNAKQTTWPTAKERKQATANPTSPSAVAVANTPSSSTVKGLRGKL